MLLPPPPFPPPPLLPPPLVPPAPLPEPARELPLPVPLNDPLGELGTVDVLWLPLPSATRGGGAINILGEAVVPLLLFVDGDPVLLVAFWLPLSLPALAELLPPAPVPNADAAAAAVAVDVVRNTCDEEATPVPGTPPARLLVLFPPTLELEPAGAAPAPPPAPPFDCGVVGATSARD